MTVESPTSDAPCPEPDSDARAGERLNLHTPTPIGFVRQIRCRLLAGRRNSGAVGVRFSRWALACFAVAALPVVGMAAPAAANEHSSNTAGIAGTSLAPFTHATARLRIPELSCPPTGTSGFTESVNWQYFVVASTPPIPTFGTMPFSYPTIDGAPAASKLTITRSDIYNGSTQLIHTMNLNGTGKGFYFKFVATS